MIREATAEDVPRLVEMGQRFHHESEYKDQLSENPEQFHKISHMLLGVCGLLLSERAGVIVGMIGFMLFPHFLSGEIVAGELFWWVEPEHRGEGIKLLKEAEKRAKAKGAKRMQMIAPNEQVGRVYQRLGYQFVESAYQRTL